LSQATKDSVLSVNIIVFRKIYGKKIEGKNGYIFTSFASIVCDNYLVVQASINI